MIDKRKYNITEYMLPHDWIVLAGKTDTDNDYLSLKMANPNDYWFHVRGMPGSHVILREKDGEEPDKSILKEAAAIAAWHSKAKNGGVTAVSCTMAKYVSKPRGAKPGTVTIKKESVLKVKPGIPGEQ
jgi:predicted ribosome quality control (RQC) complex YloA/Tae2 family protein